MADDYDQELRTALEELGRGRGYASFFQWPDRQVMERGIVADLLEFAPDDFPAPVQSISSVDQDPPDCLVVAGSSRIGVEVTELVDQDFLEAVIRANRLGIDVYDWAPWTEERFLEMLGARIAAKRAPASVSGGPYDEYLLLVHTGEPGLDIGHAEAWLGRARAFPAGMLARAYLLFGYHPRETRRVLRVPLDARPGPRQSRKREVGPVRSELFDELVESVREGGASFGARGWTSRLFDDRIVFRRPSSRRYSASVCALCRIGSRAGVSRRDPQRFFCA